MYKLAAIVGPTAVGKTKISLELAQRLYGEIISCDSMQVYKGMDIGTAKATLEEQAIVPHYLLDICTVTDTFTVADYQKMAKKIIKEINEKGKLPIMVGGTGLYYQAVIDDYDFFPVQVQELTRAKWEEIYKQKGLEFLFKLLQDIDPEYADKIGNNDKKRIIRALEVYDLTGQPFSVLQKKKTNYYNSAVVGLYMNRAKLYERIEKRVDQMLADGLIDEVAKLKKQGGNLSHTSMQAIGYKQVLYYLEGWLSEEEMIKEIKRETRHFAKRQLTWFKKDKRIRWFEVIENEPNEQLVKKIVDFVEGHFLPV